MKKYISKISPIFLSVTALLLPVVSFARYSRFYSNRSATNFYGTNYTITDIIFIFIDIINQAIVVVVALALLFFLWGVSKFIMQADNEEKRNEAKSTMVWGIIALFAMLFIWQIVRILENTFF